MTTSDQIPGTALTGPARQPGGHAPHGAALWLQFNCRCGQFAITIQAMDQATLASRHGLRAMLRRGPHDAEILRLAVPAFGALVAEPLFLLGDSAIVGQIGTVPLGGLGVASQALTTLVSISIFLAYGTTAAVARQLGAGN